MGTQDSAGDEWIELYNYGTGPATLEGWHLTAADGSPGIALHGTIPAGGYYLIERTDDHTIADIPAALTASFGHGLANDGEKLVLSDNTGTARDIVDASAGWFAGDNTDKTSMERIDPATSGSQPGNWAGNNLTLRVGHDNGGNLINGTPGARNSVSGPDQG